MQDCKPSEHDKNNSRAIGIPYLIVSYPEKKEYIYDQVKLLGELGDKFGSDWSSNSKSMRDIFKLIDCQVEGFSIYKIVTKRILGLLYRMVKILLTMMIYFSVI